VRSVVTSWPRSLRQDAVPGLEAEKAIQDRYTAAVFSARELAEEEGPLLAGHPDRRAFAIRHHRTLE